jgi:BASS family bile acid:Na+ symporter
VRGYTQTAVLGVIMLTMGMTLKGEDFRILASRPMDIVIGSFAQFTLMPLIAWTLVRVLGLPREVGVGLMLVGCCPGGVSSNIMTFLCKGDVAFSVGMTTVSTLAAPVMTPLLMLWLAGESVDVDAAGMFKSILIVTIMPVVIGFSLNAALGRRRGYGEAMKVMPGVAVVGLACIVGGVVSAHGHSIVKSGALIFAGVFLHNSLGYILGYFSGVAARFSQPKLRTISIEVGMQNAGLATVLAGRHFPAMPEAAVASAVSCVWHSISGALLAGVFNAADALVANRGEVRAAMSANERKEQP